MIIQDGNLGSLGTRRTQRSQYILGILVVFYEPPPRVLGADACILQKRQGAALGAALAAALGAALGAVGAGHGEP